MPDTLVRLAVAQKNDVKNDLYWQKYLLGMIVLEEQNFVFSTLGKAAELPKNQGTKTTTYRRYNSLPVSADLSSETLAEGVAPTPLKVEAQTVSGAVNQFGAYIKETDQVAAIHLDNIKTIYMPELARHAAEVKERNVIASFTDASEWLVNSKADVTNLVAADVLTLQEVRKVVLTMKNHRRGGHVKFGGKPVLVVHINVMQDLLDDADLKDRVLVPGNDNSPIKSGTLEKYLVYGFYMIETLIAEVAKKSTYAGAPVALLATLTGAAGVVGTVKNVAEEGKAGLYICTETEAAASTWELIDDINIYTSYLLGKDPYMVIKLSGSGIQWCHVPFTASHSQPLAQWASFGYKMWTGAKIIDPIAITKIFSASAYDVATDFEGDIYGATASQVAE